MEGTIQLITVLEQQHSVVRAVLLSLSPNEGGLGENDSQSIPLTGRWGDLS